MRASATSSAKGEKAQGGRSAEGQGSARERPGANALSLALGRPLLPLGATRPEYFAPGMRLARACACGGTCEKCASKLMRKCDRCGGGMEEGSCPGCDEAQLQRKESGGPAQAGIPRSVGAVLASPGRPLEPAVRGPMEQALGHDLSGVRIHQGAAAADSARQVNALAYTVGHDVVLGPGQSVGAAGSRELLAHELVHVVQQSRGGTAVQGKGAMSQPGDADEREADALASRVARGQPVQLQGGSGPMLHRSVNATPTLTPSTPDPGARALLVHLHTDEQNAGTTAQNMQRTRCANLVNLNRASGVALTRGIEVSAGGFTITVDPNRIFTPAGRTAQIAAGVASIPRAQRAAATSALSTELATFANDLIDKIGRGRLGPGSSLVGPLPVVAFHNNTPGDARTPFDPVHHTGPGLSIRSYLSSDPLQPSGFRPSERRATDPSTPPHLERGQSEDDFFLTTSAADFATLSSGTLTSGVHRNVVLQGSGAPDDGSLSVAVPQAASAAATAGTLPSGTTQAAASRYVNIEAGGKSPNPGVLATNTGMAVDALDMLGVPARPASGSCAAPAATGGTSSSSSSSTTAPSPSAIDAGAPLQRKLAPTPEASTPVLMRQQPPGEETSSTIVRPRDQVGGEHVGGMGAEDRDESVIDLILRFIRELLRLLDQLSTRPPDRAPDPVPPDGTGGCHTFADGRAMDARKAFWIAQIATMSVPDVITWLVGGPVTGAVVSAARDEARAQMQCLLSAMAAHRSGPGAIANLPGGAPSMASPWVVSGTRNFADQSAIWTCKFDFNAPARGDRCPRTFGRITPGAVSACSGVASLTAGNEWDRGDASHRACWSTRLSADDRQREILTTSSAPGISRHHQGTDFDLLSVNPRDFEAGSRFADAYAWLRANATHFGFIQSFDALSTFMRLGYTEERWHWSYYPVAQALLEFAGGHLVDLDRELVRRWAGSPQFSFIRAHWQEFLFNVHQTPTAPP